jgi:hypothetical protein
LVQLMSARGAAHVGQSIAYGERWESRGCGGKPIPVYAFGIDRAGRPRPKPVSMADACRKYRAARKDKAEVAARLSANASVFTLAASA